MIPQINFVHHGEQFTANNRHLVCEIIGKFGDIYGLIIFWTSDFSIGLKLMRNLSSDDIDSIPFLEI
jgi:hypothetical protein